MNAMNAFLARVRVLILPAVAVSLVAGACTKSAPAPLPPPPSAGPQVVDGYYDGHIDSFVSTDVSSKSAAAAEHINYAPSLANLPVKTLPEIYMVKGPAAAGQVMVFSSEPGEKSYSPLWRETLIMWKQGATPILITSDTQIDTLESQGKLTERATRIVLNCPIINVGKGGS